MPLNLKAVLDRHGHDPTGALNQATIRLNFLNSSTRLLESIGAKDRFHLEVVRAKTVQYVSLNNTVPLIVEVSIGILDWHQDLARAIHTISADGEEALVSASAALVRLRPLAPNGADARGNGTLLSRMPAWTDWRREVTELLESVALPISVPRESPTTWEYKAIVR